MNIEFGTLNPTNMRPVGVGVNSAQFAVVSMKTGLSQRCVVKQVGAAEIAAECFCALLGNKLGLPVLTPIIVTDPRDQSNWFGAYESNFPSLSARLNLSGYLTPIQSATLASLLSKVVGLGSVISFDELILNGDRNPGNILWNGLAFILIDHERAVGNRSKTGNWMADFARKEFDPALLAALTNSAITAAIAQTSNLNLSTAFQEIEVELQNLPQQCQLQAAQFLTLIQNNVSSLSSTTANAMQ